MAQLQAAVFSASIQNQDAIDEWMQRVHKATGAAQMALDDLRELLVATPHISIELRRDDAKELRATEVQT
jgi:hypothetical protein